MKATLWGLLFLTALAGLSGPLSAAEKVSALRENTSVGIFEEHPHWDYYSPSSHPTGRLDSVESHHLKPAYELFAANKLQYAYDEIYFVLLWFPNHPKMLKLLIDVAAKAKQPQVPEKHFRNALELYPEHAQTHMLYGIYQSKLGSKDKAIASYKRALEIDPNYAEAHYNLGLAYYHSKKFDLANTHAQRAYALHYPLPGLQRLLKEKKAWNSAQSPLGEPSDAKQPPNVSTN